jgi:hypothetical protein
MEITVSGVLAIILILVLSRPSRTAAEIDATREYPILRCGIRYKILAGVVGILCPVDILILFYPIVVSHSFVSLPFLLVIVVCISGGVRFLLMSSRYKIELTPEAIVEQRVMGKPVNIAWKNLESVTRVGFAIEVTSVDGTRIRIPQTMDGYLTLLEKIKDMHPLAKRDRY